MDFSKHTEMGIVKVVNKNVCFTPVEVSHLKKYSSKIGKVFGKKAGRIKLFRW